MTTKPGPTSTVYLKIRFKPLSTYEKIPDVDLSIFKTRFRTSKEDFQWKTSRRT